MMKFIALMAMALLAVPAPQETALDRLVGDYVYEDYRLVLPGERTVGLEYLGIASSKLSMTGSGTITVENSMCDGSVVRQSGRILEVRLTGESGYWVAKWPDVRTSVQTRFKIEEGGLSYETRFQDPLDPRTYGHTEISRLRRLSDKVDGIESDAIARSIACP